MVKLDKVFDRFPQLTRDQMNELARRRALRALDIIPDKEAHQADLWFSLGFLGANHLFTPYVYPGPNPYVGRHRK
jgi:hypothetical protein